MDAGAAFGQVFSWAILGFIVAVPVLLLLRGWADGSIDGGVALGSSAGIVALLGLVWRTSGTAWMLLFVVLLLAACAGLPLYFTRQDKHHLQRLQDEDIAKYQAALMRDPRNASAHALLGETYLKQGKPREALAHYEAALTLSPDPERNPQFEKWKHRRRRAQEDWAELEAKIAAKSSRR